MAKGRKGMAAATGVLHGASALDAISGGEVLPLRRRRTVAAPTPRTVAVLYKVLPEDRDALREEARERAAKAREAADAERYRARVEGRKPKPLTVREDASEVLREIIAKWRKGQR